MNSVYKRILDDSQIAYFYIEGIKNEDGKYIDFKIIDANKEFSKLFKIDLTNFINSNICEDRKLKDKLFKLIKILEKAVKNEKYTIKKYIEELNLCFDIDIYSLGDDMFLVKFTEIVEGVMVLSSILKKCPFCAWIKDRNGKYVDVNNTYLEIFNLHYDDIIGKTDYDIFNENVAKAYRYNDEEVIRKDGSYTYEPIMNIYRDREIYLQETKWPYKDKDNNILGTIGVAIDITERMEIRRNIEKNERNFLDIASNIEEVLIIRDEYKAIYISPSFEKMFGESPDKLYDDVDKLKELYNSEDLKKLENIGYEDVIDCNLRLKSNNDKWVWCKFLPIKDENGKTIKQIGIISDITKKKKLEKELENLRMDFFANLSHELRTPINLILSSLQVINLRMCKLNQEDSEYLSKYLNIIRQNGLRQLKLVNNLIDATTVDSGNFKHNPINHDIINFVEDICLSVSEFVEYNELSIVFDTQIEEKIIGFDLDNMERIILNLISNAIKFNKPKGKIEVSISYNTDVIISVKDSGIGIPQDKVDSVFGRFEQVKSKIKKEREGSGIGLSLVKSLVEMHNGTISLNSKLNEGSEFIITLPDVLVDAQDNKDSKNLYNFNNIQSMNIEFSDIYN